MPNPNLTRLKLKNFVSFITELPGSKMWKRIYVVDGNGVEKDVANNGELSGAYMVSSVLTMFQLIDRPHATVQTTVDEMVKAGWQKIDTPVPVTVVCWDDQQIGFYLADNNVISNDSFKKAVARHGLIMGDGKKPTAFYAHPELV